MLIDGFHLVKRRVDTAVGAVALIDVAAEIVAPACVMNTDSAVEAEPVIYIGLIVLADQRRLFFAALNRVAAGGRVPFS